MRLANFDDGGGDRLGVVDEGGLIDLAAADPALPKTLIGLLAGGGQAMAAVRAAAKGADRRLALDSVRLRPPIPRPGKFLAVGLNYRDHIAELKKPIPAFPSTFAKMASAIVGPRDPVWRPLVSDSLDYEGELAFVIGRRCRHVPRSRAREVVAGYLVANDVTVREWVALTEQIVPAKSFDTCGPIGPWLVTSDELEDPHRLRIRTTVNGETRQDGNTADMIFDCWRLVEILSQAMTLEPGDIVTTGTPKGVGHGFSPPRYLKPGDLVTVEIEGIGHISNPIIDEPAGSAAL
ncbi:MAG: fumarylacetoacetate hydrolase family protein [Proteobacteria bacterium]|nr:fumarylacetoacetate hydrolase family protein [Pseudomonadota bacterium]MBI3498926.1 fumarylacetoacetate hydrolase family protein [Pseudomonadota bacterium]